jgi:hypothetical protein
MVATSSTIKVSISGVKQSYVAGQEAIMYTFTIAPPGIYDVSETLVPEGNVPQKLSGSGSQYDSRIAGYSEGGMTMQKIAGTVRPDGYSEIPADIPPGTYHLRLDLLPLGSLNPAEPPASVVATVNSSSFTIAKGR